MPGEFYPVEGPWPGRLWIAARPRGSDWLYDEMRRWRDQGAGEILSLLTPMEERDLGLENESAAAQESGMSFLSLPVADRDIPPSETTFTRALESLDSALSAGRTVVVHCRQGIGRSGIVAACLLVLNGIAPEAAMERVTCARGVTVPETEAQREWILRYAAHVMHAK
jgi:protein-tyrosine phosphatase